MVDGWSAYLILFAAGAVAGTLNVIAGGGSLITLPLMIFLGLPPSVANGTNRVAIFAQNVAAVWGFQRHRIIDWRWFPIIAAPAMAGAALGTWLAVTIGELAFQRVLAGIMVTVALWTIWDPLGKHPLGDGPADPPRGAARAGVAGAFLLIGVYGGFVQAGIGFLILGALTVLGLNLVRGNALKVLTVLAFTPIALVIFAANGKIDWRLGAALAAGNLLGGLLGVRLTVLKGHAWLKRIVTVVVVVLAVRLWFWG